MEIPFLLLEKPYYLEPVGKGEKVYALLREAMFEAGVIGISRVVMHAREHLAALIPMGPGLVLNTIRWAREIRPVQDLKLPPEGRTAAGLKPAELKMATQLIGDMTTRWEAERYEDRFVIAVQALLDRKIASGDTRTVAALEEAAPTAASNVVDLTELLARSLAQTSQLRPPKERPSPGAHRPRRSLRPGAAPERLRSLERQAACSRRGWQTELGSKRWWLSRSTL